jgi:Ni/Fe-hydrogenase subunit HybB-like protein
MQSYYHYTPFVLLILWIVGLLALWALTLMVLSLAHWERITFYREKSKS